MEKICGKVKYHANTQHTNTMQTSYEAGAKTEL